MLTKLIGPLSVSSSFSLSKEIVNFQFVKFLQTFSLTSSNYMLVAITLDRHRAITRPLSIPCSTYQLVTAAWLVSLLPSLPCVSIFMVDLRPSQVDSFLQPECVSDFTDWLSIWRKLYFIGVAVMIFAIPLVVLISLYIHVILELRSAVAKSKESIGQSRHITPCYAVGGYLFINAIYHIISKEVELWNPPPCHVTGILNKLHRPTGQY